MNKKTLAILIPSSALAGILVIVFLGGLLQVGMKRAVRGGMGSSSDERMGKVFTGTKANDDYYQYYRKMAEEIRPEWVNITGTSYRGKEDAATSGRIGKTHSVPNMFGNAQQMELSFHGRPQTPLSLDDAKSKEAARAYGYNNGVLSWIPAETSSKNSLLAQGQVQGNSDGPVIVIQPAIPATGEGDKIIRSGTIRLEVEDGRQTYNQALAVCNELGGYMSNSNFYKSQEGRESGTITMRIPKDKFTIALDRLSALGKVENINTNSEDVSQEYVNLKSQLDAAMVVYNKMLEALQKRNVTISDAVRLESELTPVLRRVEDLKNSIEYLNNAVSFTTISVSFIESEISLKALKESKRFIREGMLAAQIKGVKFLAAALPKLVLIGILFVIAIGVIIALGHWIKQLLKRG